MLVLKKMNKNLEIVLKLNTNIKSNYKNSIITMWEIEDKRLKGYIENRVVLYKKE